MGTPVPSIAAQSLSGSGDGGSGTSSRAVISAGNLIRFGSPVDE
jgi:hypothetical protein